MLITDENAKWILNIMWEMEGVDINLDTHISKHLADLGQTLTALTAEEDENLPEQDCGLSSSSDSDIMSSQDDVSVRVMVCHTCRDRYYCTGPPLLFC